MGSRDERRGLNEAVFRTVNEQIAELGERHGASRLEIVCECSDASCAEPIAVSVAEYEEARAEAELFVVHTGHEDPTIEEVVAERGDHLLVRKVGDAARAAIATDPR